MRRSGFVFMFLTVFLNVLSQGTGYLISLAPFSTPSNHEFSPVFYKNGIVFCSNLGGNSLVSYQSGQEKLFNVFYTESRGNSRWKNPGLFSKELTTGYNEGPVTFNSGGDTVFFSRNNQIAKAGSSSETGNKLGIYMAVLKNGIWGNVQMFQHSNPSFSFGTPALSPDGKRLYFASDMPGGFGGADLYYCERNQLGWDAPVNLGPVLNTPMNESFPFACQSGKLFFASDGHPGYGGKDLFYSMEIEGKWISPVHLDSIINTPYDDFGLVADAAFLNGYFSSNRRKSDDIYRFSAQPVTFPACDSMVTDNYCFEFFDEYQEGNDSVPLRYTWDFGNGVKMEGQKVQYCLPGPGSYNVKLVISENKPDGAIINETPYDFELRKTEQVFIDGPDAAVVGAEITFNGLKSHLPDFLIEDYIWDFGEGFIKRGSSVSRIYHKKGEYKVQLGMIGKHGSARESSRLCSYKKIRIFDDFHELAMQTAVEIRQITGNHDSSIMPDGEMAADIYLMKDLSGYQRNAILEKFREVENYALRLSGNELDAPSSRLIEKVAGLAAISDLGVFVAVHSGGGSHDKSLTNAGKWVSLLTEYFALMGSAKGSVLVKPYGTAGKDDSKYDNRVEFIIYKK